MSIAENIKRIRLEHGLSQAELGKIAGVSDKAVSTWELGLKTPRMGAVEKMANYFGITKSAIVDDVQPTPAAPIPPGQESKKAPGAKSGEVSDEEIKFALFGGGPVTDAQYEEVKQFVRFIKERDANAGKG